MKNENGGLLDDTLRQLGLSGGRGYGLEAVPTIQPVLVVDPQQGPLNQYGGITGVNVPAVAANRSEIRCSAGNEIDWIARVYVHLFARAASPGYEVVFGVPSSGIAALGTRQNSPYSDTRLGVGPLGMFVVSASPVAGSIASTGGVSSGTFIPGFAGVVRLGPYWLPSAPGVDGNAPQDLRRRLWIRPVTDNEAIDAIIEWQMWKRPTTVR